MWTECQIAELKNGSLLLTSRLGISGFYCNGPTDPNDPNCFQRGFARSDVRQHTHEAVDASHLKINRGCNDAYQWLHSVGY
jgi:hypothetical protein